MIRSLCFLLLFSCALPAFGQSVTMPPKQACKTGERLTLVAKFADCASFEYHVTPKNHAKVELVYTDDKSIAVFNVTVLKSGPCFLVAKGTAKDGKAVPGICEIDADGGGLPPIVDAAGGRGKGYVHPSKEVLAARHAEAFNRHGHRMLQHVRAMTAPATWDSRTLGWIPPIRDQGNCGSCYGVSASDALTVAFIKAGYQKADGSFVISEQAGMDCGYYQGGCNGGDGPQVYNVMRSTGFPAEKYVDAGGVSITDYPGYTASRQSCRTKPGAKIWKVSDWGYVTSDQSDRAPTVDEVKAGIINYGTVTFAFDAGALSGYNGNPIQRLGNNIDHEITGFMGWDDGKKAFLCRNQWGRSFGDGGYFWLGYSALPNVVEACFLHVTSVPVPPGPTPPDPPTPPSPDGAPVITSAKTVTAPLNGAFSYQIVASNNPVAYFAFGLPNGLTCDAKGTITGKATAIEAKTATLFALNASGAGTAPLVVTVTDKPIPPAVLGSGVLTDGTKFNMVPPGATTGFPAWLPKDLADFLVKAYGPKASVEPPVFTPAKETKPEVKQEPPEIKAKPKWSNVVLLFHNQRPTWAAILPADWERRPSNKAWQDYEIEQGNANLLPRVVLTDADDKQVAISAPLNSADEAQIFVDKSK
jgi:hypothetical protein